jgi:thiol-disulfide isomerase/thioredoxin
MKKTTLLLTLLLLIRTGLLPPLVKADEPVVRAVLFWSENCSHCHAVIAETMPPLQEQYGSQLDVRTIEVSDPVR